MRVGSDHTRCIDKLYEGTVAFSSVGLQLAPQVGRCDPMRNEEALAAFFCAAGLRPAFLNLMFLTLM
jgi:hypothetical protein